jgi:hypothetical protein
MVEGWRLAMIWTFSDPMRNGVKRGACPLRVEALAATMQMLAFAVATQPKHLPCANPGTSKIAVARRAHR